MMVRESTKLPKKKVRGELGELLKLQVLTEKGKERRKKTITSRCFPDAQ